MYNDKSRDIGRRHYIITQLLYTGVIYANYVKSKDNIVNLLTKGLNRELVDKSSRGMGLKPMKEKVVAKGTQPSSLEIARSRFKRQPN